MQKRTVTLKAVAEHVGLTAGTVSVVLNDAPQAKAIPPRTRERILAAARELNYQPNPFARALRAQRMSENEEREAGGALVFIGAEHCSRAIQAMQAAGLRVPGDVSIVGFENLSTVVSDHGPTMSQTGQGRLM